MNELNLDRLNLTSPYTLWRTENNSYGFRTNYGVILISMRNGRQPASYACKIIRKMV